MQKRIQKVLIANRGEIARRVIRTCRVMGISTVAIYSEADASMPHVREADEAVCVGPAPSAESYLVVDAVVAAAKKTGADAVHPGYGFLAENAAFADACFDADITFIGPSASAIRAMGSKKEAKAIVREIGVPVVPGYDGADQDPAVLAAKAKEVGFPVLFKAALGGGGKGMKLVREEAGLEDAIASARREAESSFGDGTLLVEKYIEGPRHVEVQILGDAHGNVIHLYERECSIQRRHQKVIEETPSPALNFDLRQKMGEAAVLVAQAIGYQNAGTVEFILAPDGSFYFLEVNTRLQVEHPVTECVTGLDLVEEQLRVARGERLRYIQDEVPFEGHAIEARIYAENPAKGFLPQSGRVIDWHVEPEEGLRVDAGVESGTDIGIHYDPMLAKIIVHAEDRATAIDKLDRALGQLSVLGLTTNREFLRRVLQHEAFRAGHLDTHFIDRHFPDVAEALSHTSAFVRRAAVAATMAGFERRRLANDLVPDVPRGYRNNAFARQWAAFDDGSEAGYRVDYLHDGGGRFRFHFDGEDVPATLLSYDDGELRFEWDGVRRSARVVVDDDTYYVQDLDGELTLPELPRFPEHGAEEIPGGCISPMPGKVVQLSVAKGDSVEAGQVLLVMEAMKMEHEVTAPDDGVVLELHVAEGEQVEADTLLAIVGPATVGPADGEPKSED